MQSMARYLGAAERYASLTRQRPPGERSHPVTGLVLDTSEGSIEVELFEAAAPATVQRLKRLAAGPIFDPDLVPPARDGSAPGFYDGLAFVFTRPHVEIVTTRESPPPAFSSQTSWVQKRWDWTSKSSPTPRRR